MFKSKNYKVIESLEKEIEQSFILFQDQIKQIRKKQEEELSTESSFWEEQLKKTEELLKMWVKTSETIGKIAEKRKEIIILLKPVKKEKNISNPNKLQRIFWTIPKMKNYTLLDKIKVSWLILIDKPKKRKLRQ